MIRFGLAVAIAALSACTDVQEIRRPGGVREYLILCGAATGFNVCYRRANELCPGGYENISEKGGFNRKELRVRCTATTRQN